MSDIEIGDVVTIDYKKGYWRVEGVEVEVHQRSIYQMVQARLILKESGKIINSKSTSSFTSHYVNKVTEEVISNYRKSDNLKWDTILRVVNPEAEVESDIEVPVAMDLPEPEFLTSMDIPDSLMEEK
jgi:ABC-type oligopeptide transport system ATPase subunit